MNETNTTTLSALSVLQRPFPADAVSFRVGSKKDSGAQMLVYIDAADVMDRLDEAGIPFSDSYRLLETREKAGTLNIVVSCSLRAHLPNGTVTVEGWGQALTGKEGVLDDKVYKSAESDAFKRAAVKLGIGRILRKAPFMWCKPEDFDAWTTKNPRLNKQAEKRLRQQYAKFALVGGEGVEAAGLGTVVESPPAPPTPPSGEYPNIEKQQLLGLWTVHNKAAHLIEPMKKAAIEGATLGELQALVESLVRGEKAKSSADAVIAEFDAVEVSASG